MPLCGFNGTMIEGIAKFADGLFAATIERGKQNHVEDLVAVATELREIGLFIEALKDKNGAPEEGAKAMAEMVYGIAVFADGLFRATLAQDGDPERELAAHFKSQVKLISVFLERLENTHQVLRKTHSPAQTMKMAVEWIDQNDVPLPERGEQLKQVDKIKVRT